MRRLAMFGAAAVVLGGIVGSPSVAWAGHDSDDLTVFGQITDMKYVDRGEEGFSEGDKVLFAADLTDKHGDAAGLSEGACKITDVDDGGHGKGGGHHGSEAGYEAAHDHDDGCGEGHHPNFDATCRAKFALDGGKIFISGDVSSTDLKGGTVTLPIAGGRGDYKDAAGEAVIEFLGDGHDGNGHGKGHGGHHGYEAAHDHGGGGHHANDDADFKVTFYFE